MKVSLNARNLPRLCTAWALNVAVFSGIVTGALDVRDLESLRALSSEIGTDPWAGWPYAVFLTLVSVFNGAFPRSFKKAWCSGRHLAPVPVPSVTSCSGTRRSTGTRYRRTFAPFPSDPDEQNALWAGWLNEFEDDARVRPAYGHYLFARDWTAIAVATLVLAGPLALWLAADVGRALAYGVVLLCQCAIARWIARVRGEQLVMSVLSCKGSSLAPRLGGEKSNMRA